jgi:hypothetical protein
MTDSQKKSAAEILAELNRVRALLATRASTKEEDIPLLDEVVTAGTKLRSGATEVSATPEPEPAPPPPLPSEGELEELIDRIIDREMPRIRLELKRVLRDELRMRDLLK